MNELPIASPEMAPIESWAIVRRVLIQTAIIFAAAVILVSGASRSKRMTQSFDALRYKWNILIEQTRPADWLILGDSTGMRGLSPELFKTTSGRPSLNLCAYGNTTTLNDTWLLKYHIQRFGPPKHVLIMRNLNSWLGLGKIERPLDTWADIPLHAGPLFKLHPLPSSTVSDWPSLLLKRYGTPFAILSHQLDPSKPLAPPVMSDVPRWHLNPLIADSLELEPVTRESMDEIVRLANTYHFDVDILPNPSPDGLWTPEDLKRYGKAYDRLFGPYTHQCPTLHILTPAMTLPAQWFAEPLHLSDEGARLFTQKAIDRIAQLN